MSEFPAPKTCSSCPEHLSKSPFVLKLAAGVDDPKEIASTYVVTPALVDAIRSPAPFIRCEFQSLLFFNGSSIEAARTRPKLVCTHESLPFFDGSSIEAQEVT